MYILIEDGSDYTLHVFSKAVCVLTAVSSRSATNEYEDPESPAFYALVHYEDDYVQPLILDALNSQLHGSRWQSITTLSDLQNASTPILQITSYETIDFYHLLANPSTSLANSYIIRKALIRKHYLAHTVSSWLSKHPTSILENHVKPTLDFELDYAEFLDEALLEAYELHESFARNADLPLEEREWWILKPSMSDRGHGIRLFSSEEELRSIFEEWESDAPDSDASEADDIPHEISPGAEEKSGIMTSQLRHFIVQPYIHPPLLLPSHQNRKFHLRSYVLAVGSLRVYVYQEMLALFAPQPYVPPCSSLEPEVHLTNTCLQTASSQRTGDPDTQGNSVHLFSALPLPKAQHQSILDQISTTTGELFEAAARGQMIYFQTLPNAFEVFGVDWLVDAEGKCWLLEVNAFPDFRQSGEKGMGVVKGFWEAVVGIAVAAFFGVVSRQKGLGAQEEAWGVEKGENLWREESLGMRKVLDIDLGRR